MADTKLVHELGAVERNAAVAAYVKCHGSSPDLGFAPDRAWIEGWVYASVISQQANQQGSGDAERYRYLRDNCVRVWVSRLESSKGAVSLLA